MSTSLPLGVITPAWPGDNTPSPSSKQCAREFSPIIMASPDSALLPYSSSPDQLFSGQVGFLSTPQLHKIYIPQRAEYSSGSCPTTASPNSTSDTLDHLNRDGISIHYIETSYQIEMGLPYESSHTGEDNVLQSHLNPEFSLQNPYYSHKETLQLIPEDHSYDDFVQSVPMSYNPQSISYPAHTDLPVTYGDDPFDSYEPPSSFASIGIQQQQKLRPVGSPAITRAAGGRRERAPAYQCQLCRSTFTAHHNLKNHLNAHKGLKLHLCQNCGRSFVTKHVLTRHQRTLCSRQTDG
ncbi:hypothetical protein L218DRAFT_989773 [Marasmius fiardii PR-910]|nr:hypothetical protein L218DRAFT_989773 [Marasmius fiardii PR-910]